MPGPGNYTHLTYNSPLSAERAAGLVSTLAAGEPRTVLDVGCGWGELLLRVLSAVPAATGTGLDTDSRTLARGRANAERRGLGGRVTFVETPAAQFTSEPVDVVICLGSSQAFGTCKDALTALHTLVRPGGRLLFGDGFWERPPSADLIERLGGDDGSTDLAGTVRAAIDAGFRPLAVGSADRAEWEAFESGYLADWEEWLVDNAGHPDAEDTRAQADEHRDRWLTGYRDVLGFCYLLLGRPA